MSLVAAYSRYLSKYPLFVQCGQTGILFGTGDVLAQQFIEQRGFAKHDVPRTLRLAGFGGVIAGPIFVNWYAFLDRFITIQSPFRALLARVSMDQFLFAPSFIALFFSSQGLMERKSPDAIKQKLRERYPTALVNNYKVWPAVQLVNFYFVPLQHRLLVVNTVALGWNTYMSLLNQATATVTLPAAVENN